MINTSACIGEEFAITSFRTQIGIVSCTNGGLISVMREGKQHQQSLSSYWKPEERQACSHPFLQLLPCFSLTRNRRLSKSLKAFAMLTMSFHISESPSYFTVFSAFQWLCSVIHWIRTKMLGCYLQLTLATNPSPEMHELLGNGEEKRRLFPTFHLQQATHLR